MAVAAGSNSERSSIYGKLKCSYVINLLIRAHNTTDAIFVDLRLNLMKVNQVCVMIVYVKMHVLVWCL